MTDSLVVHVTLEALVFVGGGPYDPVTQHLNTGCGLCTLELASGKQIFGSECAAHLLRNTTPMPSWVPKPSCPTCCVLLDRALEGRGFPLTPR